MKATDSVQRFMFEHASIRGEIAHLDNSFKQIIEQHSYPPVVKNLLGEALVSCILMAGSIKFEGEVSLQFHGDKRLPLLLVQCDNELNIRGFAKYQEAKDDSIDYAQAFLEGKMVLIINQYHQTQTYQSVVPLRSTSMGENLMHYFAQSEQIPTQVLLVVSEHSASGMLLQLMPGQKSLEREQFWKYAIILGQTLSPEELSQLPNETILRRLYHETEIRLFPEQAVRFRCRCTPEKMKQVLTVLGEKDIKELLAEKGEVEVSCDFCNTSYHFDAIDITLLFRDKGHKKSKDKVTKKIRTKKNGKRNSKGTKRNS